MVKLIRIVKKIVGSRSETNNNVERVKSKESYSSRGKSQPTIDFTNLPSLNLIKFEKENVQNISLPRKGKSLLKVSKGKDFKNKKNKNKHESYKIKVKERDTNQVVELNKLEEDNESNQHQKINNVNKFKKINGESKKKEKIKVIKSEGMLSRGKRKRQLKKDAWRRKYEFEKEAKKMIEKFQKEDKHGKALTNLTGIKSQLDLIEESIRSREQMKDKIGKNKSKFIRKAIIRNRNMFKIATNNL